jgi:hypothetical protein
MDEEEIYILSKVNNLILWGLYRNLLIFKWRWKMKLWGIHSFSDLWNVNIRKWSMFLHLIFYKYINHQYALFNAVLFLKGGREHILEIHWSHTPWIHPTSQIYLCLTARILERRCCNYLLLLLLRLLPLESLDY